MRIDDYCEMEWDYLLLLDATRYDVFEDVVSNKGHEGKLSKANVGVCETIGWYNKYWGKKNDVILFTSHPYMFVSEGSFVYKNFKKAAWVSSDENHRLDRNMKMHGGRFHDLWHPKVLIDYFKKKKEKGHRYLLHFIPPHLPFIYGKGREFLERNQVYRSSAFNVYKFVQDYGRRGNWDELRKYYRESLEITLEVLFENMEVFGDGKTVITSDHGELIGEPSFDDKGYYFHGKGLGKDELLGAVPWFEVN